MKKSNKADFGCYYDAYAAKEREHSKAVESLKLSLDRERELNMLVKQRKLRKVVVYEGKDMRYWFEDTTTGKKVK